jgi:hypothetical protein
MGYWRTETRIRLIYRENSVSAQQKKDSVIIKNIKQYDISINNRQLLSAAKQTRKCGATHTSLMPQKIA